MAAATAREVAPQPAVTRLAWGLCLLAWLLLADGLVLGALNVAEQYAPLALGLTTRQLSLPGGELASWVASWAFVPGIVIGVVFLVLLFPDGRLPSRRWWPLGLAGPERPARHVRPGAALRPLPRVPGAALQLAGLGIGIFRFRLWDIDRLINRTLVYGLLTALLGAVYAGLVLALGQLSGGIGTRTPSWAVGRPPWPWPPCPSRPAAASSRRSTCASTGASTTPP